MVGSWRWAVVALCFVMVCVVAGCGRKAEKTPAAKATPPAGVGLPDWAPKNPSPEFLRAAKVLKPLPAELLQRKGESVGVSDSVLKMYTKWWAAGYDLFGTLSDRQVARVRSTGLIRLRFASLTPKQRQAFESFMAAKDSALAGVSGYTEYRVVLYKFGAKQDLSNVDVGFEVEARVVMVRTWIPKPQAPEKTTTIGDAFAMM